MTGGGPVAHSGDESVSRCPANLEFCRSSGRQTGFDEFLRRRNCLGIEWRAPGFSTASSRCGDAVAGPFGDEPSLEVRDGAEDVEYELAGGRGGIEALLETDQMNGAGLEAIDDFEKLSERASQTVEPGDAQAVARSSVLDELGKTGAVRTLSGGDVGEETDGACLEQAVSGLNPTKGKCSFST